MPLTTARIQVASRDVDEYHKGVALYEQNAVTILRCDSFWKGETNISAQVQNKAKDNHSDTSTVVIAIAENRVRNYTCSNEACKNPIRYGLCRHAVAVAMHVCLKGATPTGSLSLVDHEPVVTKLVSTNSAVRKLIHAYEDQEWNESLIYHQSATNVTLKPTLKLTERSASVSFEIGNAFSYVLKDLSQFAEDVVENRQREYGKKLKFTHTKNSFSKESQEYVDFIIAQTIAKEPQKQTSDTIYVRRAQSSNAHRSISLTRHNTDAFMSIAMIKGAINVENQMGLEEEMQIKVKNPKLPLVIEAIEEEGVKLLFDRKLLNYFEGEEHLYLCNCESAEIYVTDQKYTQALRPFLYWMTKNVYALGTSKNISFEINMEDYPKFCGKVLRKLLPYIDLQVEEKISPAIYFPDPLEIRFYFDLTDEGEVSLKVEEQYGDLPVTSMMPQEVVRDYLEEQRCREVVEEYFLEKREDGTYALEDSDRMFELVDHGIDQFLALGEVFASDGFQKMRDVKRMKKIKARINLSSDLLDIQLDVPGVEASELRKLLERYHANKKYYRMKDGSFLKLEGERIQALDALTEAGASNVEEDGSIHVGKYRMLYVAELLQSEQKQFSKVEMDYDYRQKLLDLDFARFLKAEDSEDETIQALPQEMKSILRPYQRTGVSWMKMLADHDFSGILADEMGLGKTVEVIALLTLSKGPNLIVSPASLVYNWESEIKRFAPELRTLLVLGDAKERQALIGSIGNYDIAITSYDLLRRDVEEYATVEFDYQILDEAQYIKNHETLNAKSAKQIHAKHKFALTGTPMENRLSELWSIFDYCMPGFLLGHERFQKTYEIPIVKEQSEEKVERLRKLCGPFIMRRLKKDVLTELPEKVESVVNAQLSGEQELLYKAECLRIKEAIQKKSDQEFQTTRIQILAELTRLRQICCDPTLCFAGYEGGSAKLDMCIDMVKEAVESGHKLLLFSQFTSMLHLIEERLKAEGIGYFLLTGSTPKEERSRMVRQFQQEPIDGLEKRPVFLISLKAGGTGLNLTAADIVIHYDPWWNVAVQNQATDRVHRIGQKHSVNVYKLIAKGSIEERIVQLQQRKQELADSVVSDSESIFASLDKEELLELLQ